MDYAFPEKYFKVARYFDYEFGDLETTTKLEDQQKLILYALRKQAEHGPCTETAPAIWRTRERVKHAAWSQLGNMSKFEAMVHFVKLVEEHLGGDVNWLEKCSVLNDDKSQAKTENVSKEANTADDSAWDTDLREHVEPTPANIKYLASEVMRLRGEIRQLRLSAAERDAKNTNISTAVPQRIRIPVGDVKQQAPQTTLVPPEKPVIYNNKNNNRNNISFVPPVRSSPIHMTEAAVKSGRVMTAAPRKRVIGWAEWLGLS
ncbi:Acyl-CoA-binding protein [Trypanosoma melophagium]|uniref:Acyl-CoA-binding protein n=1 Tax=Trypanosoma melophagium TaxID=715481 RepID=UPI003519FB0A|nr:Acyl-CoA-binding protein [Trypanosoma melophagium]